MDEKIKKELKEALEIMQEIIDDRAVPRNIRKVVSDALEKINKGKPTTVDCSMAIYLLDDISNDINMPAYTRTSIWTAISRLESVKEHIKELE
ncbi:MAG: hypothetical protein DRO07_01565 [Candidatus Iainarchaeum archaeon]|uniref:UPF0147 protein DRO07_01565 n=1 Tax=Candidatus Iainarchaeum sp. TaxID=3101447 RepID=A0A497JJ31_9ARCH|nr:MAG: hypothetical protein DRO07_01565 [Candidatus Diapherotrites archaeon]